MPELRPIKIETMRTRLEGTSPLLQHKFSYHAREQIRLKKMGGGRAMRQACDPE